MSLGSCIAAMGDVESIVLPNVDIVKIMDSGQCFRIVPFEGEHRIVAGSNLAFGFQAGSDLELIIQKGAEGFWRHYFDMEEDYKALSKYFKSCYTGHGADFISASVDASEGLHLLAQDSFEALLSFIISQRKRIPFIRRCIESLCELYGTELIPGVHAFPTPAQLENADFRKAGVGYRAAFLQDVVTAINNGTFDLEQVKDKSYDVALSMLKHLYGVGDKVANCTLLYGMGFNNAFPIDVWVDRIIITEFNGDFPYQAFPAHRGILQMYMFYYKRRMSNVL